MGVYLGREAQLLPIDPLLVKDILGQYFYHFQDNEFATVVTLRNEKKTRIFSVNIDFDFFFLFKA